MAKVMLIDIDKCIGCYNCQIACKDEHVDNDWSPIAKPQPDTGQFWMKVTDIIQGTVPKVRVRYMHDICQHCDDAPCIAICDSKAIYKRDDGIVIIDPEKCTGSRQCLNACPYKNVIYFNMDLNISQKCTFCAHLLDKGWKEPRCVDACPTEALRFGEEPDMRQYIEGAEIMYPEHNTKPRVYYKALPNKYFITGAVCDPDIDECLEGCKVTLDNAEGFEFVLQTDDFGDFWFERLIPGIYNLTIEKTGYDVCKIGGITAEKDVNIGDIELHQKT